MRLPITPAGGRGEIGRELGGQVWPPGSGTARRQGRPARAGSRVSAPAAGAPPRDPLDRCSITRYPSRSADQVAGDHGQVRAQRGVGLQRLDHAREPGRVRPGPPPGARSPARIRRAAPMRAGGDAGEQAERGRAADAAQQVAQRRQHRAAHGAFRHVAAARMRATWRARSGLAASTAPANSGTCHTWSSHARHDAGVASGPVRSGHGKPWLPGVPGRRPHHRRVQVLVHTSVPFAWAVPGRPAAAYRPGTAATPSSAGGQQLRAGNSCRRSRRSSCSRRRSCG